MENEYVGECIQCAEIIECLGDPALCFWCMKPMCWVCHEDVRGQCSTCAAMICNAPAASQRVHVVRRPGNGGGRPEVITQCKCGVSLNATEKRKHRCLSPADQAEAMERYSQL